MSRILFALLLVHSPTANAYVTSAGAVPMQRQVEWLKEMTIGICESQPGQLSAPELDQVSQLMYAWSHLNKPNTEGALAVESLVKRLLDEQRAGNAPPLSVAEYNCLLQGWAACGQAERCDEIVTAMQENGPLPDRESFRSTLVAWKNSGAPYAPLRAQRILEWMIRLYENRENKQGLPDAACFDTVLQTWSRSGRPEAPERAEKLLLAMEVFHRETGYSKVRPRRSSFNAVLQSWSNSVGRNELAADRSLSIVSFMELLAMDGDKYVAPDASTYNTAMRTVAGCPKPRPQDAEAILMHAEQAFERNAASCQLQTIIYNSVMGTWAKSKQQGAFRRAKSLLDRQISYAERGAKQCHPDVFGYTSVIACCAAEELKKEEAFQIAIETFRDIHETAYTEPNHVTYGTMMKACVQLLPPGSKARRKTARRVFHLCRQNGCVGDMVLSRLREAAPDIYRSIFKGGSKVADLPESWTRNVCETNEHRLKRQGRRRAEV